MLRLLLTVWLLVFAPLALSCGSALGAERVRAMVRGAEEVEIGGLIELEAVVDGKAVWWWVPQTRGLSFRQYEGNRYCVIGSGNIPGAVLEVMLIGVPLDDTGKIDGPPFQEQFSVTVRGTSPVPPNPIPPNPVPPVPPNPSPDPVFPVGKYGFSKLAYDLAKAVPSASRSKANALGANFDALAAAMAAGAYATPKAALNALALRNRETLGTDRDVWLVAWFTPFQTKQSELISSGALVDTSFEDFVVAYREVAIGLRAVQ